MYYQSDTVSKAILRVILQCLIAHIYFKYFHCCCCFCFCFVAKRKQQKCRGGSGGAVGGCGSSGSKMEKFGEERND